MARYTGPVCRLCRRQGMKLFLKGERCFTPKCAVERRPTPPGQPPSNVRRRRKESEYSLQLKEKQKARNIYGILERQFHKHFVIAERMPGVTGENLLRVLEMRLDNVVYRMGFAATRAEARQLVSHKAVAVNEKLVNIASYQCKAGDVISLREKAKKQTRIQAALTIASQVGFPDWVEVDDKKFSGILKSVPDRQEILPDINESLVVELYSK